jgi:DNA invertase Pin-like site-specific DNA recombinase
MLAQRTEQNHGAARVPLRAALWMRQSTEEQSREDHGRAGLGRQREVLNRLIAGGGYDVVKEYALVDVSGTDVVERTPEFKELLSLIVTGTVQAVLVSDISRLMRVESWESLAAFDVFTRHRCIIVAENQTIDFTGPEGFLTGGIFTLVAGHQRMEMLRKINAAKEILRRSGKNPSAAHTLPRGLKFCRIKQEFSYDPDEVGKVQEAFRLLDPTGGDGAGVRNLAEVARRIGWKRTGLRGNLQNEAWLGFRVYDEKRDASVKRGGRDGRQGSRPKVARQPHEVVRIKFTDSPAVDAARFARVQEVLNEI